MYVRLSVANIDSSFFVSRWNRANRAIFGRHFSMTKTTKRCFSNFHLGTLTPKIYSPKFAQNRL